MHRRAHPCVGIDCIESFYSICKNIIPDKLYWPQFLPAGEKNVDYHGNYLRYNQECHKALESFRVVERKIHQCNDDQCIPKNIGNDEILTEGDYIIQLAMDNMAFLRRNICFRQVE